jgi:hypothetical protein
MRSAAPTWTWNQPSIPNEKGNDRYAVRPSHRQIQQACRTNDLASCVSVRESGQPRGRRRETEVEASDESVKTDIASAYAPKALVDRCRARIALETTPRMLTSPFDSVKTPVCHKVRARRRPRALRRGTSGLPREATRPQLRQARAVLASRPSLDPDRLMAAISWRNAAQVLLAPRSLSAATSVTN